MLIPLKQGLKPNCFVNVVLAPLGLNVDSIKTRIETLIPCSFSFRPDCLNVDSIKTRIETSLQPTCDTLTACCLNVDSIKTRIETGWNSDVRI